MTIHVILIIVIILPKIKLILYMEKIMSGYISFCKLLTLPHNSNQNSK